MPASIKIVLAGIAVFVLMDFLWLGVIARGFYKTELSTLARLAPDGSMAPLWAAAVPVYLILALGVFAFVLPRADGGSWLDAAGWGAAFGLVSYGLYDLTNLATLRNYSLKLALIDMAWGAVICGTAATAMKLVARAVRP